MYPNGIIYHIYNPKKSGLHGEANLHAKLPVKILYTLGRGLGAGVIGFVVIALIFSFGPLIKDEISYRLGQSKINYDTQIESASAENISSVQAETRNLGVNSYFSIVIPKIGAKANIVANVDPTNESEYDQALKEGVAHAKGTYFPGQGKTIFLFSHSTNSLFNVSRYNAIFYLLDKMSSGDKIVVYFSDKRYIYKVTKTKIVGPNDTSFLNGDTLSGETLILQTCYPPGTSLNRLLVFAKPAD